MQAGERDEPGTPGESPHLRLGAPTVVVDGAPPPAVVLDLREPAPPAVLVLQIPGIAVHHAAWLEDAGDLRNRAPHLRLVNVEEDEMGVGAVEDFVREG